jgi:histidine triad (HIT) family protein
MNKFFKWLIKFKFIQGLIGLIFARASSLVPGERLRETANWMVIPHPKPAYPVHFLIMPKKQYKDWLDMPVDEPVVFSELIDITQSLVREYDLQCEGYRLIINGGEYQTFPHLHFHLISGSIKTE